MSEIYRDREILTNAQERGAAATAAAFFRLSGPGWLQSAITLGGGSLVGALYLGMLGGTHMLWLQLVAIVIGVIMLSAISYVTLSTNVRPYRAINDYVNPVLGVGWIAATILANMIWITSQYSLCYDSLDKNLTSGLGDGDGMKIMISLAIAIAAIVIVILSFRPGIASQVFDWILKLIVAMIVLSFVAVVYYLATTDAIVWADVWRGFIPDFSQWNTPSPEIQQLLTTSGEEDGYWKNAIIAKQQSGMIGVTATAVGLNMTFLLPYSMLARGWDKPFRGLARFDLITAMAIPYIIVTTCIVIASAHAFHAKADASFLSNDPAVMQQSMMFKGATKVLEQRLIHEYKDDTTVDPETEMTRLASFKALEGDEKTEAIASFAASLSDAEKRLALTLVKPNASQLASTLAPLMGEKSANLIFGFGAFAMGFSTIVILMLINGYAFAEMFGNYKSTPARIVGAVAACAAGFTWIWFGQGVSRTWLVVVASTFGAILLPIAYICFFALMNNRRLLGDEKPTGIRMTVWNVLMTVGVLGAVTQAIGAIMTKADDPQTGPYVVGGAVTFALLALVGFTATRKQNSEQTEAEQRPQAQENSQENTQ